MGSQRELQIPLIRGEERVANHNDLTARTNIHMSMNISRLPMIRTLSLSDLMEVEEEKNEEEREETNLRYNPHDTADPHLYLSDQLENEKVNPPSKKSSMLRSNLYKRLRARLIVRLLFGFPSDLSNSTNISTNSEAATLSNPILCCSLVFLISGA